MAAMLIAGAVLVLYMSMLFLVSLYFKNNGVADIGYGIGFVVLACTVFLLSTPTLVSVLLFVPLLLWAMRLSGRIFLRNKNKPEDFRYAQWRKEWGKTFLWRSFLQVYVLQGVVIFVVALPLTLTIAYPASPWWPGLGCGLLLWVVGYYFEVVGDAQLDRFLKDPVNKGKIMQRGLWRYSRHPNYFGEATMWWGFAVMALCASSIGWAAFLSPVLITYLLLFVSGVPMLEKRFEGNREWEVYKEKTSVFVPWLSR